MVKYAVGTQGVQSRILKKSSKLYYWKDFFFKFKGTPSREEHKTGFCVLTTTKIEIGPAGEVQRSLRSVF
jgi:hypothetical protein